MYNTITYHSSSKIRIGFEVIFKLKKNLMLIKRGFKSERRYIVQHCAIICIIGMENRTELTKYF